MNRDGMLQLVYSEDTKKRAFIGYGRKNDYEAIILHVFFTFELQ